MASKGAGINWSLLPIPPSRSTFWAVAAYFHSLDSSLKPPLPDGTEVLLTSPQRILRRFPPRPRKMAPAEHAARVQEKLKLVHCRHHLGSAQRGASAGACLSVRTLFKAPSPAQRFSSSLQLGPASRGWCMWLCDLLLPSLHFPLAPSSYYSRRD